MRLNPTKSDEEMVPVGVPPVAPLAVPPAASTLALGAGLLGEPAKNRAEGTRAGSAGGSGRGGRGSKERGWGI